MRIGYDGKRAVQNFTGLGNYSRYVVQSLSAFAPENEYWLYAPVHRENQQLSSMVAESRGTVSVHYPSYWLWRGMTVARGRYTQDFETGQHTAVPRIE